MTNQRKIVIADDHILVAQAYKSLLEPKYEVVASAEDGRALVRIAATFKPHVIVLDIGMPVLNALDAGWEIEGLLPSVKLGYLTTRDESDLAGEAFNAPEGKDI